MARNGRPVAKIVPWTGLATERVAGSWAGRVDFGDDLVESDPDIVEQFDASAASGA